MKFKKFFLYTLVFALLVSVVIPKQIFAEDGKLTFTEVTTNSFASGPNFSTKLENVYDGNPATNANYAAKKGASAYENNPHFLFNLGVVCDISRYEIVFPNTARINHYELYISTDDVNYTKIDEFKGNAYPDEGKFEVTKSFSAKYIKLVATGAYNDGTTLNENYMLNEFTVYGQAQGEVTNKKITIQSGTMAGFSDTSPVEGTKIENAFDGNQSNYLKVIGNSLGDNAYFTFDLGGAYSLDNIIINFGTTRAHFYKILVSTDGENFTEVEAYTSGDYEKTDGFYVKEENLNGVVAKYIRVVAFGTVASPGNQYYNINEISLYGNEATIEEEETNPQTGNYIMIPAILVVCSLLIVVVKTKKGAYGL